MCAICNTEPATCKSGASMYVCAACKVLMEEEAGRRLRLVIDALEDAAREREAA